MSVLTHTPPPLVPPFWTKQLTKEKQDQYFVQKGGIRGVGGTLTCNAVFSTSLSISQKNSNTCTETLYYMMIVTQCIARHTRMWVNIIPLSHST